MGRKKLSLTDEERILRKKEQMKKVYERQKLLKKRIVENLHPEQLEKKRSRDRIENLNPEQLEKHRARRRIENLSPEQLEKKRKCNILYYENIRNKRLKLMLGLYEAGPQVEYFNKVDLKKECDFCDTFEGEMARSKNNCCQPDISDSFVSIKEEKRDENESTYMSDSFVVIKEEKTDGTESAISVTDIKQEAGEIFCCAGLLPLEQERKELVPDNGGLMDVKLEEESLIPDDGENLHY